MFFTDAELNEGLVYYDYESEQSGRKRIENTANTHINDDGLTVDGLKRRKN